MGPGNPRAEVEGTQPSVSVSEPEQPGAGSIPPVAKAPPPHLRAFTEGEEAQQGRGTHAPSDQAGDGPACVEWDASLATRPQVTLYDMSSTSFVHFPYKLALHPTLNPKPSRKK